MIEVQRGLASSTGRRWLVTGGAGFIGSHLVDRLLAGGHQVTVLDDLSSGSRDNLPLHHPHLLLVEGRVGASEGLVDDLVHEAEVVCHLASTMGVLKAHQEPYQTADNILRSGLEVTEACARQRRPLLAFSSSEVYGVGTVDAREDSALRLGNEPRFSYAAAKLAVEHLVLGLHRSWGVPSWVVRPFNVVGPRQSTKCGHVLPSFLHAAMTGADLVIHGDGQQRRTFLHVADFIRGVEAVLGSADLVGRPVNLGGNESRSILEVAELVVRTLGASGQLRHVTHEEVFGPGIVDPRDRRGRQDRLSDETGWGPQRTLEDAVRDAAAWLRPRVTGPMVASAAVPSQPVAPHATPLAVVG